MTGPTTAVILELSPAECAALNLFLMAHPADLTPSDDAHLLLRDALIGMGDLDPHPGRPARAGQSSPRTEA